MAVWLNHTWAAIPETRCTSRPARRESVCIFVPVHSSVNKYSRLKFRIPVQVHPFYVSLQQEQVSNTLLPWTTERPWTHANL